MPPQTMRQFLKPPEKAPDTLPRTQSTMSLLDYFSTVIQGLADPTGWTEPKAEDFDNPHAYTQALKAHGVGQLLGMAVPLAAPAAVMLRNARTTEEAVPAAAQTLKAFHGSPHDFGEVGQRGAFKMSAIGSGEGGQAYSYGHYFAENPQVAADYRKKLADGFKIDGKGYEASTTRNDAKPGNYAANALSRFNGDVGAAAQWLEKDGVPYEMEAAKMLRKAKSIENWEGHGYELNLHTSPESLLDWDKPLSQQPKKVIDWLRQSDAPFGYKAKSKNWRGQGALPDDVWLKSLENTTGEELYRALVTPIGRAGHTEGIASQQLADAGIHGVQYLDQGSRGKTGGTLVGVEKTPQGWQAKVKVERGGDSMFTTSTPHPTEAAARAWADEAINSGTRNYVIFPHFEHLIEISKKYGISLPAAASLYKWQQSQKGVE